MYLRFIVKLFYWISKTNYQLIEKSPAGDKIKYLIISLIISLITLLECYAVVKLIRIEEAIFNIGAFILCAVVFTSLNRYLFSATDTTISLQRKIEFKTVLLIVLRLTFMVTLGLAASLYYQSVPFQKEIISEYPKYRKITLLDSSRASYQNYLIAQADSMTKAEVLALFISNSEVDEDFGLFSYSDAWTYSNIYEEINPLNPDEFFREDYTRSNWQFSLYKSQFYIVYDSAISITNRTAGGTTLKFELISTLDQVKGYFESIDTLTHFIISSIGEYNALTSDRDKLLLISFGDRINLVDRIRSKPNVDYSMLAIQIGSVLVFLLPFTLGLSIKDKLYFKLYEWKTEGKDLKSFYSSMDQKGQELELEQVDQALEIDSRNLELLKRKSTLLKMLNKESEYFRLSQRINDVENFKNFQDNLNRKIKIKTLEVHNISFYGSFRWDFEKQNNILLGKNGYGKTHILELLIALLQANQEKCEDFFEHSNYEDASISLELTINEESNRITFKNGEFTKSFGKIPILALSDLRYIDRSSDLVRANKEFELKNLSEDGAFHFLNNLPLGNLLNNVLTIISQDYFDNGKKFISTLTGIFNKVFQALTDDEFKFDHVERGGDSTEYRVFVLTEGFDHPLPMQRASQGTVSVISIFSLIFHFMQSKANMIEGSQPKDLAKMSGIVFIDEVDSGLHPQWQRKIIGLLNWIFPRVQFIITSHSPMVVAGRKPGEVNVLRKQKEGFLVEKINEHFIGSESHDLYKRIFEIEGKDETYLKYSSMVPFKKDIEERFEKLMKKIENRLTVSDKKRLQELHGKIKEFENAENILASGKIKIDLKEQLNETLSQSKLSEKEESELRKLEGKGKPLMADLDDLDDLQDKLKFINEVIQMGRSK